MHIVLVGPGRGSNRRKLEDTGDLLSGNAKRSALRGVKSASASSAEASQKFAALGKVPCSPMWGGGGGGGGDGCMYVLYCIILYYMYYIVLYSIIL